MPMTETSPLFMSIYQRHADSVTTVVGNATTSSVITPPASIPDPQFVLILPQSDVYIEVKCYADPEETTPGSRILPGGVETPVQIGRIDPRIRLRSTSAAATAATIVWAK